MDFEPLDEELEEFLRPIVEQAAETGWADDVDFMCAEYRELKRLGMFDSASEYYSGTARVQPTYAAMKYFERKKKWKTQQRKEAVAKVGGKVAEAGAGIVAKLHGF